ncbi:MAG: hypothetical protein KJ737_21490 [Proteobacteria bacterium]|nr:hypothetical protein [Pseudomonadota bacterium]
MNTPLKILFFSYMMLALAFGFMHHFIPDSPYTFERLHIFLFNLCSGGTIVLYYTEGLKRLSLKSAGFLVIATVYAILVFLEIYKPAILLSIGLAIIVESIRIKRFSLFPVGFFKKSEPVYEKFHQASLLCLSMGLVISSMVILNNEYFHIIKNMPKLQLNTFFLGFSFPLSLITMSMIFSLMPESDESVVILLKNFGFWSVNLGVIIFFLFIIFERLFPQVIVTLVLFFTVIMIFFLFRKLGYAWQQKNFLSSGIGFLIFTAVTGILYILFEFSPEYTQGKYTWLLKLHAFASLYGWNICGLAIILRIDDFPLKLHSGKVVCFHWLTVIILLPLGIFYTPVSIIALASYFIVLYLILFTQGTPVSLKE